MAHGGEGGRTRIKIGQNLRHLYLLACLIVAQLRTQGGVVPELKLDEMEASWNVWAKTPKRYPSTRYKHRSWGGARPGVLVALNWVLPVYKERRAT